MVTPKKNRWEWLIKYVAPILISVFIGYAVFQGFANAMIKNQEQINNATREELIRLQKEKADKETILEIKDDLRYIRNRLDEHMDK